MLIDLQQNYRASFLLRTSGLLMTSLLLLLLLLGRSVAAPGDEDVRCPVPEYPVNVKVLMDSWRYHTLITEDGGYRVWTATTTEGHGMTWTSEETCGKGSVSVCSAGDRGKWLQTQFINKTLPAPNTYPVRIFVNITYSFMDCPRPKCDDNFELLLANYPYHGTSYSYGEDGIMPDNSIQNTSGVSSGTKQFFFDSETSVTGIGLEIQSFATCVTVSRVLVYHYECSGHDRLSTGLERRPATQAPVSGSVSVTPYCAENSHFTDISAPHHLMCTSKGTWDNDLTRCECNTGYSKDEDGPKCEAIKSVTFPLNPSTEMLRPTTATMSITVSVPRETSSGYSYDGTQTSLYYPSTTPSLSTAEEPTVDARARDSGGGLPIPILAGVGAPIVVILTLALVVIVALVIALLKKHKKPRSKPKDGDEKQLSNPVYDAVSQNILLGASTTSNGSGANGHKQDDDTIRNFSNPLYKTSQHSVRSNAVSESHTKNLYFNEPQYSVPNGNGFDQSEYEVPVTTPTSSEGPTPPPPLFPPPHVYEYAMVPTGMAPEYATLEPPAHAYHTLEFPSGTNGAVLPAVSAGREGGGGETDGTDGHFQEQVIGEK